VEKPLRDSQSGVALIIVLLMMTLTGALMVGFLFVVMNERRLQQIDRDRMEAFYAAHGGLEKLTSDLGVLFINTYAPTGAQVRALNNTPPNMTGVTFVTTNEGPGYAVTFPEDAQHNPVASQRNITAGPFAGFTGLLTRYTISVTAQTGNVGEVRLQRVLDTVAIPLFQFGQFSDTDIAFHPASDFDFGGRIHTNGNLFLAAGTTLTISDKVTAVGEVIRTNNPNGQPTAGNWPGNVRLLTAPGAYRNLATNEGSLVTTLGSALNEPKWTNISLSTYHGNIRNGRTGARRLDLPLVALGYQPIDLIRRPAPGETVASPGFSQRYFSLASLRILLSDTPADILNLPGVSATAPLSLGTVVGGTYAVDLANGRPPLAVAETPLDAVTVAAAAGSATIRVGNAANFPSPYSVIVKGTTLVSCTGTATNAPGHRLTGCTGTPAVVVGDSVTPDHGYRVPGGTGLNGTGLNGVNGGVIKIEEQTAPGAWTDVTLEILKLGFAGKQSSPTNCTSTAEPSPNAVIRIERVKDLSSCITGSGDARLTDGANYWPKMLYDTREALYRENAATNDVTIRPGGIMHYVELDVNNLKKWFLGTIGASGPAALNTTGYTVYFSDRRNNRNAANQETGEYGFEDFVNPASAAGTPNGALDAGEDVNSNGVLDNYGQTPRGPAVVWTAPLADTVRPWTVDAALTAAIAQSNPPRFFRRALKLVNGKAGNIITPGLTVAAENPVYVQGDYNANAGFPVTNVACAVIGDAVTLLSNSWNDKTSFTYPHNASSRAATDTWYRFAVLSGKGRAFPYPGGGTPVNFGSDGGTHNFMRFLESWAGHTVYYRGAMASLFYNRQAVGTFKDGSNTYDPPERDFLFDTNFLQPALLPPRTPMFRDINTLGFTQILTPPR
jgi:hypothetical protein